METPQLIEAMRQLLHAIEEGIRGEKFPETSRIYIQQLGRQIRETLEVVDAVLRENTVQTSIAPSSRSAMYHLRRGFYATLSRLAREQGVDRGLSQAEWRRAAGRLIRAFEEHGISEAPCKIVLTYEIAERGDKKYMRFTDAKILYFELEGVIPVSLKAGK